MFPTDLAWPRAVRASREGGIPETLVSGACRPRLALPRRARWRTEILSGLGPARAPARVAAVVYFVVASTFEFIRDLLIMMRSSRSSVTYS